MRITTLIIMVLLLATTTFTQSITIIEQQIYSAEIYFDFGKDTIRQDADSSLLVLVQFCETQPSFFIKITAHTDGIGSNENNLALSQRRGESVKSFLIEKGVTAGDFQISVFGENKPIAENNTDDGRQQNRRATIEVIKIKKMVPLTGTIVDKESGEGIEADIVVRSKDTKDSLKTDNRGYYSSVVPLGEVIGIDVWARGYFLESKMMKVAPGNTTDVKVELPPVKEGEKVDIDNLFFVGNQAVLLEKSEPEMPKILKFMQINPGIKIEIAGHINRPSAPPVSKNSWDYGLSVRRALLVYNYLIENGIAEERLTHKGYGNWEMRFPNATSSREQAANRRVEIRVLEMGE
jgi:outer membrane protein OmpA-like peptidoglycan-associated protein